jgi:response regulator RpfG family c-di-GMP phosphodiesterase
MSNGNYQMTKGKWKLPEKGTEEKKEFERYAIMNEKILFVDDEVNVLQAYQRSLRKEFRMDIAIGPADGLMALASQGPYAVIISDMRMPGMDGAEFLAQATEKAPEAVRIMLTGNADQQTAIDAVNKGHIFRFLTKPCSPELLSQSITAGIEQYRLVTAEKELLGKTLGGSIQMLIEVLSLINPTAFGRSSRVRRLVRQIATEFKIENLWQMEIAAMLSQIGCITVPEETLLKVYRGQTLLAEEVRLMQAHPQIGHDLIKHIPRLEQVAEIIGYQDKLFNGGGVPQNDRQGYDIPLGARILKLALDFDKLTEAQYSNSEALDEMRGRHGCYDPNVLRALETVLEKDISYVPRLLMVDELTPDMILTENIFSSKGLLLLNKGQEVTRSLCLRLKNFRDGGAITEPIKVMVPVVSAQQGQPELSYSEANLKSGF